MTQAPKRFLPLILSTSLAIGSVPSNTLAAASGDLPEFTDITRVLQSQPVVGGHVLAWNHMAANALGLQTAPGRVGDAAFEKSVFNLVGVTIKKDTPIAEGSTKQILRTMKQWDREGDKRGKRVRVLEVEMDAHGGAGRAAYLKVPTASGDNTWVNIKGIGLTGAGNAKDKTPGPPSDQWASHSDGGAMLAEGLREYINGIMSHNELKYGGSRVIGVLEINQEMRLTGGDMDSLVIIVREPWRRMDRARAANDKTKADRIPWALGQANAKRIMKGDFVNSSNMGFDGGFIDYGLISFVNGFVPAKNYLKVEMFDELNDMMGNDDHAIEMYQYAKGFYLLNQVGFEEPRIQQMVAQHPDARARLVELSEKFRTLIRTENVPTRIDYDQWSKSEVRGNFRAQELFRSLLYTILTTENPKAVINSLVAQSGKFVDRPSSDFPKNFRSFLEEVTQLSELVIQAAPIANMDHYAQAIRQVAEFKNRDLWNLLKEPMWQALSQVGNEYRKNHRQDLVQKYMDDLLSKNKLGTGAFDTTEMNVSADANNTYIHLPAFKKFGTRAGLKLYPELPMADPNAGYLFEVSFDGGKTSSRLTGNLVENETGLYYKITVPHGAYPVTPEPLTIRPIPGAWNGPSVVIKGPPLFLNERLGLLPDLVQVQSQMRARYGIRVGPDKDAFQTPVRTEKRSCNIIFRNAG